MIRSAGDAGAASLTINLLRKILTSFSAAQLVGQPLPTSQQNGSAVSTAGKVLQSALRTMHFSRWASSWSSIAWTSPT